MSCNTRYLELVARSPVVAQITELATAIAAARRTYVVADGSYAALVLMFAHNARLAGYDVEDVVYGAARDRQRDRPRGTR